MPSINCYNIIYCYNLNYFIAEQFYKYNLLIQDQLSNHLYFVPIGVQRKPTNKSYHWKVIATSTPVVHAEIVEFDSICKLGQR